MKMIVNPMGMRDRLLALKREHTIIEDSWYSCPKAMDPDPLYAGRSACGNEYLVKRGECTCGADAHNERIDAIIRDFGL